MLFLFLQEGWKLVAPVCKAYFSKVQALYKANPYHNNTHAADVTQTSGVILTALDNHLSSSSSSADCAPSCSSNCSSSRQDSSRADNSNNHANGSSNSGGSGGAAGQLSAGMSKLEKFSVIFASIVHDLAHPGVNNYYLVSI